MIKAVVVLSLMILTSCIGSENSDKEKADKSGNTSRSILVNRKAMSGVKKAYNQEDTLSSQIDKVEILCLFFGEYYDNSFRIFLSNSEFNIVSAYDENDTIYTGSDKTKNKLTKYINQFYINKNEPIILSKDSKPAPVTDYPFIKVEGFKEGKELFKQETTIYSNIKFNPNFLKFYEFLDNLVKKE